MEMDRAIAQLAALAQDTRLSLFRVLAGAGPSGLAAGELAARLAVPAPTLSFHLMQLKQSGLASARRDGRHMIYAARFDALDDLVAFLANGCCQDPGLCLPKTATQRKRKKHG